MRIESKHGNSPRSGGALLAVLWLSAALSAIAFSVANTVRGEIERTSTAVDGVKSYYLAAGALERALLYMQWGPQHRNPDGSPRYYERWMSRLYFTFPSGDAVVEVIPATARLNLNAAPEVDLFRLLMALGAEPERAREIALGIMDWRSPVATQGFSPFDRHYLALTPSFRARHASFEEVEEALLIKGMTPELFYGSYARDPQGRLIPREGFKDCVSVYGSTSQFDVNTAAPALLHSLGLNPEAVAMIVEMRRAAPFRTMEQLEPFRQFAGPGAHRLTIGGNSILTLRATARLRLAGGEPADLRRSVAATVKLSTSGDGPPYRVLRWHDNAPSPTEPWP